MPELSMPATIHRLDTAAVRREARAQKQGARPAPLERGRELDALSVFILLVGLVPFIGLAITRDWSPAELGIGAVMVIFSSRQLLVHRGRLLRRGGEPRGR